MKQYIKPTVNVVELSVKENIAALPNALVTVSEVGTSAGNVVLTTYNLAAQTDSSNA